MKRFILSPVCLTTVCLTAILASPTLSMAQSGGSQPERGIGLIDMALLFKEYDKFSDARETLRNEIKATDEKAKQMAEQMQTMQAQMKSGEIKQGSPEYSAMETKLISMSTEFETFKKKAQVDFLRKESKIYKEIYLEVSKAVSLYADYYNYSVILRFSRDKVEETDNPKELIQNMNRQVVWHKSGIDITDAVLKYLDQTYQEAKKNGGTVTK